MKDTQKILRHAVFNALNGNLTYDGNNVPVYDEKKPDNVTAKFFVLLSTQQEVDENTHDTFITLSTIDLEIIHKTGSGVTKDAIDNVSELLLQILLPTPVTFGIEGNADFQMTDIRRERTVTRVLEISPTESIIRKIITISSRFVQAY